MKPVDAARVGKGGGELSANSLWIELGFPWIDDANWRCEVWKCDAVLSSSYSVMGRSRELANFAGPPASSLYATMAPIGVV